MSAFEILPDERPAFAIAPIHVVAEELIQAVAYGNVDDEPSIVVEHHPLSRRSAFLEPFAVALEEYLQASVEQGSGRIYLPHESAIESLALLGARFETNAEASPVVSSAWLPLPSIVRNRGNAGPAICNRYDRNGFALMSQPGRAQRKTAIYAH